MEFLCSFLRHHFKGKQWWHPKMSLPNTPSHWWFSKHFCIFSNFSHFTGVFYSSKSWLTICGLSGHYGSWSYELLCHQVHWSGQRWLTPCRVFLMANPILQVKCPFCPYPRPNLHDVACFCYRSNLISFGLKFFLPDRNQLWPVTYRPFLLSICDHNHPFKAPNSIFPVKVL